MDAATHRRPAPILATIGLREVLEGAPDLIFACDAAGRLLWINAAVEELTGRSRDELIGQSLGSVMPPREWRRVVRLVGEEHRRGAVLSTIDAPVEVRGGSLSPISARVRRFQGLDQATVYIGVARESAADAESGAELEQRLEQVTAALEEARTVAQLKADTLATMTHEIRSPMNGILGLLQILLEGHLDAEQRGIVEILQNSSRTLLALVNDTLEFSRLEAGKVQLNLVDFDVVNTVHDVAALLAPIANEKGLAFDCRIAPEVPRGLHGDGGRIRQVLMNLATNAIKFTETGSVRIRVDRLQPRENGSELWFAVHDTGIGIAPDAVARLFQPYEQADAAIAHRFGGTGLGLSICRKLVTIMGGEMGVESTLGEGSTFWFRLTLPAASAPVVASTPLSSTSHGGVVLAGIAHEIEARRPATCAGAGGTGAEPEGMPAQAARRGRILVVEDSHVNQLVALWTLQTLGYQVDTVASGQEAIERCAAEPYDVILLDLALPDCTGFEVARALRDGEAARGRRARIAAMTGAAGDDARARCLEAGMDDFLTKPIDLDVLAGRVRQWMADATPAGPSAEPVPPPAPEAPAAEPTDARPAIDLAALDTMSMGSSELRSTLLQTFADECEPRLNRVGAALEAGDARTLEFEAHGLKSMTGTIGAKVAEDVFDSIERLARAGDLAAAAPRVAQARDELRRVLEVVRSLPRAQAA